MAQSFIAEKEEGLIFLHRTAQYRAELVPLERRKRSGLREEVARRHNGLIAEELVGSAMKLIAAGFGGDNDLPARCITILRRVNAGENIELLNGVNGRAEVGDIDGGVVVIEAVQGEVIGGFRIAGNIEAAAESEVRALHRRHYARRDGRQREEGTAIERHLDHARVIDDRAQFSRFRVDGFRTGDHRYVFRNVAHFQTKIAAQILRNPEGEAGAGQGLEAGGRDLDVVDARLREREPVGAGVVCLASLRRALRAIGQFEGGVLQDSAAAVRHHTG